MWSLSYLGELRELGTLGFAHVQAARARGNLFAAASIACGPLATAFLAEDAANRGRREVDDLMARWSQQGFHTQHMYALVARSQFDLYEGEAEAAYRRVVATWPSVRGSRMMFFQIMRIMARDVRGRVALAFAASTRGSERARVLREVTRLGRRLRAERMQFSSGLGSALLAGAASLAGRVDEATRLYATAAEECAAAGMEVHAAAARWRRGGLVGGDEGRALVQEAERALAEEGVRSPVRMISAVSPGSV